MRDSLAKISLNEPVAKGVFRLRFPVEWEERTPGQFVMVSIPSGDVFLRRPFGIARLLKGEAEICYKVVGKGTLALSRARVGAEISVLGPCGNGFVLPEDGKTAVLVAGGYGIAPLFGLAENVKKSGRMVILYYGAKDESALFYVDELKKMKVDVRITTEDGSAGEKGMIMERIVREMDAIEKPELFSCGPAGLLRSVAEMGAQRNIKTQISVESCMACGMGVCLGCVRKDAEGNYVRVCREGPVFDASRLLHCRVNF